MVSVKMVALGTTFVPAYLVIMVDIANTAKIFVACPSVKMVAIA